MPRTAALHTGFALGAGVVFAVFEFFYLRSGRLPYDGLNYVVGWDFVNSWMGGRAALHGDLQSYFEVHRYNAQIHHLFAPNLPFHNWSYPPHILLLLWPFGLFPYLASYALWLVAGFGVYLWAASDGKFDRELLLFLALSPVAMVLVLTGQNGFFTGALLLGVLAQWDKRPVLAGIMLGLLSVKPQLVLLMPLVLMMTGRWRCLAAAASDRGGDDGAETVLYGPGRVDRLSRGSGAVPEHRDDQGHRADVVARMMPTAFINARLMGAPDVVAWALQAVAAVTALAAVAWTFCKRREPMLSNAMLLAASLLVTPYSFNYDMAALIAVLAQRCVCGLDNSRITDTALILIVWMLPVVMMLGFFVKLAGSALVLAGADE